MFTAAGKKLRSVLYVAKVLPATIFDPSLAHKFVGECTTPVKGIRKV
jgi:hypothetical protein